MTCRVNKYCAYFPCHAGLEDCTFCYCPFYPCKNERRGKFVVTKNKQQVWSCKDCSWIHQSKTVDRMFAQIRNKDGRAKENPVLWSDNKAGIVIIGHGSRLKSANEAVRKAVRGIKTRSRCKVVEPAYLQLCKPNLSEAVWKIAKAGCHKIIVVPYFLFMGNHVTVDIPAAIQQEARTHKNIKFVYAKNIGQDPRILDALMGCITEVLR